jgi:hypothetical protein
LTTRLRQGPRTVPPIGEYEQGYLQGLRKALEVVQKAGSYPFAELTKTLTDELAKYQKG